MGVSPVSYDRQAEHRMVSVQVAIAVLYCLLSAGVVFGYAALKPVLIEEGVYREFCSDEEISASDITCYGQEIRYEQKAMVITEDADALQTQCDVYYCSCRH